MKASELVTKLTRHIETYGDADVLLSLYTGTEFLFSPTIEFSIAPGENIILQNGLYPQSVPGRDV